MLAKNYIYEKEQCYKNFTSEYWNELSNDERREALQKLENYMAKKQDREPPRKVVDERLDEGVRGEFRRYEPNKLYIDLEKSELDNGYLAMLTIVHEGRHAYQYDVVNADVQDDSISDETKLAWGKNFICYSKYGMDYLFQSIEDDASFYANEVLANEFRIQFERYDLEAYKLFLSEQEKFRDDIQKDVLRYYEVNDYKHIQEKSLEKLNRRFEQMKNDAKYKVEIIQDERREEWEIEVERAQFRANYTLDLEEALRQIEAFERGEGVALKDKNPPRADVSYSLKTDHISPEQQLESLQEKHTQKEREIQSLNRRADNMAKYIKNIRDTESGIAELKKNRETIPNADSRIKKLENSRQKAHEFFKNEYNVQPEKADETIEQLREQATAEKRALRPTEEKMKILRERQKELEMERSESDSPTKENVSKSIDK